MYIFIDVKQIIMCIHLLRVYDVFFLRYNHYLLTFLYTRGYVFIMTLQFVVPGETEADSSPVHVSLIDVQVQIFGKFSEFVLLLFLSL